MAETIVERWLPVVGYEGLYSVSDLGRVRSETRVVNHSIYGNMPVAGRTLKPATAKSGYHCFSLWKSGKGRTHYLHVLMMESFVGPRPNGFYACHTDGNPSNNTLTNLRWDTPAGNSADAKRHGTAIRGETSAQAKVTANDVLRIRAANGPLRSIAKDFGVHVMTVSNIRRRKTWAHL